MQGAASAAKSWNQERIHRLSYRGIPEHARVWENPQISAKKSHRHEDRTLTVAHNDTVSDG